jgi:hypothetical protein
MAPRKASAKGPTKGFVTKKSIKATKKSKEATKKTAEVVAKKKTNFFDLNDEGSRKCWEKILTIVLVQKKPILITDVGWSRYHGTARPLKVPGAACFKPGIHEIGTRIYFSENTFYFSGGTEFANWTYQNKKSASLLRKIGVDFVRHYNVTWIQDCFKRCTGLQELSIGIDELALVKDMLRPGMGFQRMDMRPQDVTPQLNLLVLRANHMDKLRQIRVPKMRFTPLIHGSRSGTTAQLAIVKRTTGPIRGGILEKVVAREIMQPQEPVAPAKQNTTTKTTGSVLKRKTAVESDDEYKPSHRGHASKRARTGTRIMPAHTSTRTTPARAAKATKAVNTMSDEHVALSMDIGVEPVGLEAGVEVEGEREADIESDTPLSAFRILDLPAELRNKMYHYILVHRGPINPSKRVPTTYHRAGTTLTENNLYRSGVAPSSCLAFLQTSKQIYAEARGIFYAHNSFVFYYPNQLMMFLHSIREERRRYIERVTLWYKNQTQGNIDSIDTNLAALMQLKNLKRFELVLDESVTDSLCVPGFHMPGEYMMKEMAKGLEVVVRNQALDYFFWKRSKDSTYMNGDSSEMASQKKAICDLSKRIRPAVEESEFMTEPESQSSD